MPDGEIYDLVSRFRRELLQGERQASAAMVRAYGQAWGVIQGRINNLVAEYNRSGGVDVGPAWLYQYERLTTLRQQVEQELQQFAKFAEGSITDSERQVIDAARQHTEQLTLAGMGPRPVGLEDDGAALFAAGFNQLPRGAVTNLVGFLLDGSPLAVLLGELPGTGAQIVSDGLLQGLMLGQGARQIASNIRAGLGGELARALTIARTETLRAYRESSHQTYQANAHLVKGWIWRSARNVRTCGSCWAMDGTEHTLDERLDDHPNGRCFEVPVTKTWKEMGYDVPEAVQAKSTGIEAFGKLSAADQLTILGPAKFAAWRDGAFQLSDLVGRRWDARWGSMRYEKSLKEMGLDAKKFLQASRTNPVSPGLSVREAAKQILETHTKTGGSTISLSFGNMAGKPYYSISVFPDLSRKIQGKDIDRNELIDFIQSHEELARNAGVGIGTWYNQDDGFTYLDFVVLAQDREHAISLGRKYNQIGIFGLEDFEYIETGGSGETIANLPSLLDRLRELDNET